MVWSRLVRAAAVDRNFWHYEGIFFVAYTKYQWLYLHCTHMARIKIEYLRKTLPGIYAAAYSLSLCLNSILKSKFERVTHNQTNFGNQKNAIFPTLATKQKPGATAFFPRFWNSAIREQCYPGLGAGHHFCGMPLLKVIALSYCL